jgi:hypothetical protein
MTKSEIIKELHAINDNLAQIERVVDLLYKIQLSQGPLIEVITIIKYEKPHIYPILKIRLENKTGFKILFEVSVEHEIARKSLGL